jgi:hypothetical protein
VLPHLAMEWADKQRSSDLIDDPNVVLARNDAGTGIGSDCQIPRAGQRGSMGDIGRFPTPRNLEVEC